MYTKKANEKTEPSFRAETAVYDVPTNKPDKAVNLATGEVRDVSELKQKHTWQRVTLKQ